MKRLFWSRISFMRSPTILVGMMCKIAWTSKNHKFKINLVIPKNSRVSPCISKQGWLLWIRIPSLNSTLRDKIKRKHSWMIQMSCRTATIFKVGNLSLYWRLQLKMVNSKPCWFRKRALVFVQSILDTSWWSSNSTSQMYTSSSTCNRDVTHWFKKAIWVSRCMILSTTFPWISVIGILSLMLIDTLISWISIIWRRKRDSTWASTHQPPFHGQATSIKTLRAISLSIFRFMRSRICWRASRVSAPARMR